MGTGPIALGRSTRSCAREHRDRSVRFHRACRVLLDPSSVLELAARLQPDLVIVGPEAPLVAGVADALRQRGVAVFGPNAGAARIEGSKTYAKQLMERAGIPPTRWGSFTAPDEAVGVRRRARAPVRREG